MSTRLASRRYALLVDQLGDEIGRPYGWQSRVARRLGIDQSTINRLVRSERTNVGADAVERAIRRLRLDPRFFYDAALGDPDYRDFARGRMKADLTEALVNEYLAGDGASLPESVKGELRMLYIDGIDMSADIIRAIARELVLRHSMSEPSDRRTRIVPIAKGGRE